MTAYSRDGFHILHIHIPKTAGLTLTRFFENNEFKTSLMEFGPERALEMSLKRCSYQHMHGPLLETLLNVEKFNYVFSVVRHPISRFRSAWMWNTVHSPMGIDEWATRVFEGYKTDPYILDNHIRPQNEFLIDRADTFRYEDGIDENFISRLESNAVIRFEYRKFSLENNVSPLTGLRSQDIAMTSKLIDKIFQFYSRDFEILGYDFDPQPENGGQVDQMLGYGLKI